VKWVTAPVITGALCLLAGCATTTPARRDFTLATDSVIELVRLRGDAVRTLRGEGVVTIESPEQSGSSSFNLNLKKPDSILVNLSGPFGIRFGTLQFSRDRFTFYNYQDNYAFIGKSDGTTLHSMFNLRMTFDEVMRAFTGEFLAPGTGRPDSVWTDAESYVLTYRSAGGGRKEYRVDAADYFVRSYRVIDSSGRPTLTAMASEPEETDGTVLPRLLRVVFPEERRSISVAYSDVEINREASCSFTIPKSADIFYR
jgi:outer membrane lipoprotein-sorting protein